MGTIRKGRPEDIPAVAAIYDRILAEEEAGRASVGWVRGVYPTRATAQAALEAGELFVLERDGAVMAAAKINQEQVPEYVNARWAAPDAPEEEIMVLHTLVVDPLQGGKGCGTKFVRFYEDYALSHGAAFCGWTPTPKTPTPGACTPAWAIGRRISSPATSTAFRASSWSAWRRLCSERY